ncbi:hypothetical protein FNAPI_11668 [Fusarium napiforme]|uniref:Uncharacterized protein n=1 Tax=Fusarium napiforme TaxID=42672 RepID=A0A8H5MNL7_9HYPO|nr:hypothetical protein FNAPI_11668 [Fusarium napiforme]
MSRQEVSYFDIVPEWQTSIGSQQGTGVRGSPNSTSTIEAMDESDVDSDSGNGTDVIENNATVPAKRRQAFEDTRVTREEINELESRLNRTTVLCVADVARALDVKVMY